MKKLISIALAAGLGLTSSMALAQTVASPTLDAIKAKGRLDQTLVIFLCDNGAHPLIDNRGGSYPGNSPALKLGNDNLPFRAHKTKVYEGGIRTPGLVYWPGRVPAGELETPLHAVDWMPTLCALAGYETEEDLNWDGRNTWPALRGERPAEPRPLYWAGTGFRSAAARDGDWKLIVTRNGDKSELFHLGRDPYEQTDLADEEPERVAALRELLAKLAERDNDSRVPREPMASEGAAK